MYVLQSEQGCDARDEPKPTVGWVLYNPWYSELDQPKHHRNHGVEEGVGRLHTREVTG